MARVTIEDCLTKVENRFRLVLVAAQRARDIIAGAHKLVNSNDKEDVLALREISEDCLDIDKINEAIVARHQKHQSFGGDNDDPSIHEADLSEEMESGNQDSIITDMYESESYGDDLPEGEMLAASPEDAPAPVFEDEDEDEDDLGDESTEGEEK